jgi:hypothetical protein
VSSIVHHEPEQADFWPDELQRITLACTPQDRAEAHMAAEHAKRAFSTPLNKLLEELLVVFRRAMLLRLPVRRLSVQLVLLPE